MQGATAGLGGGALSAEAQGGLVDLTLLDTRFECALLWKHLPMLTRGADNRALDGGAVNIDHANAKLTIRVTLSPLSAGASLTVRNCQNLVFVNNSAAGRGGALFVKLLPTVALCNQSFVSNRANVKRISKSVPNAARTVAVRSNRSVEQRFSTSVCRNRRRCRMRLRASVCASFNHRVRDRVATRRACMATRSARLRSARTPCRQTERLALC